jgi:signal transduction histidine kinase/ligand-binding sensor domain-containing protein
MKTDINHFRNKIFSMLIYFFAFIVISQAQNNFTRFESLTINDGLSQGSIKCMLNDSQGFVWFGTQDGLNRFDGYSFKIFRREVTNPNSISNNNISSLAEDSEGNIWIGTSNGLNKLIPSINKFQSFATLQILNDRYSNTVYSVLTCKNNIVWFSTNDGLFELNSKTGKINKYRYEGWNQNSSDGAICKIIKYNENTIIVGAFNGSLFKFDTKTKTFQKIIYRNEKLTYQSTYLSSIVKDSLGNIWIGSYSGLFKYNLASNQSTAYSINIGANSLMGDVVTNLVLDKNDNLWISLRNYGLSKLNIRQNSITNIAANSLDPKAPHIGEIFTMMLDKSEILWLGTNGYGVYKFNPYVNNFLFYTQSEDGMSLPSIRTFYEFGEGKLLIGGYGGMNQLDLKSGKFKNLDSPGGIGKSPAYIFEGDKEMPEKILWVGTEGDGVYKYDLETGTFDKRPFGNIWKKKNLGSGIYAIWDDSRGNLWVGNNKGLDIVNKINFSHRHFEYDANDPKSISPQSVNKIYRDREGNVWIGTDVGGLNLIDQENFTFKRFSQDYKDDNSLSNNFVKTIYEDHKGRLWIGTNGGGLNLMTDRKKGLFKRITSEDGLPNDVIYGILEDKYGNLWMSSNMGLCKYNPDKNVFTNYDSRDGLQSNEFNTNAYYKNAKGDMYFGGVNGFNIFNPEVFNTNKHAPNIVITNFELFNSRVKINQEIDGRVILKKTIEYTKQIELDYDENVFSLEFSSLDFASPFKNKYSYILEGFDKKWTEPSEYRKVTYTNLHPGRYVFKVKGTNNDGVWSAKPAELVIVVVPPFWQTWWFIILAAMAVLTILIVAYFQRIKTIESQKKRLEKEVEARTSDLAKANENLKKSEDELIELNKSKDKFFSILAHDLRGPFSGVIGLSEIIVEDIDELEKDEIKELSYSINQLLHEQHILLENLLDWSRIQMNKYIYEPEKLNLSEIASRVYRFLYNNAASKQIALSIDVPEDIYVTGNSTMLISVVQNLLSNAIKFTNEGGTINITAVKNENEVKLSVTDSGVGMNEEAVGRLFVSDVLKSTDGTSKEKGSGIGLMLVKEFVARMHGTIKVESKISEGTKFIITFPLTK